jgi:YggT family protein
VAVLLQIVQMILDAVVSVLVGALLLRFWMQAIRVRPPASVAQFIFTFTDWLVRPLRRIVPGVGGYDWASLIGAFPIMLLDRALELALGMPAQLAVLLAFHSLLTWIIYGFMGLLFIEVVFSWINPYAPLAPFVRALNAPLLRPFRRAIPPVGGLDLSVMVAMIVLAIARMILDYVFGMR